MRPALIKALEKLVTWVQRDLLPIWGHQRSLMPEGCVGAGLDRQGMIDDSSPVLLSSQAEIAYMLARADRLGWTNGNRPQVQKLIEFAGRQGTLPCRSDGYVHSIDRDFSILDDHHHLTDHALFILASTAAYSAYGDGSDARRAYNIFDWLQRRLAHPQGGWFDSSDPGSSRSPRSHFYTLLAFLYLYEISRKPRWLDAAEEIVALYQRMLQHNGGPRLYRDYREDGTPAITDTWYTEDQFLWVYGVQKFVRCSGRKLAAADHYHSVCESQALGRNGIFVEKLGPDSDGAFATSALAAAILAGISLAAAGDQKAAVALENQIHAFFNLCVLENPSGLFVDRMDSTGAPEAYTSAATTFILFDAARDAFKWLNSSDLSS